MQLYNALFTIALVKTVLVIGFSITKLANYSGFK